jgi:TfoX/Sxy family transcriptional regulator of competence genes
MDWTKSSARLVELFDQLAPREPDVERRQMFGWPCCFVNGHLFAGLHKESMIFRLPEAQRHAALGKPGAAHFALMPGRQMKEYVAAAGPLLDDRATLVDWIASALAYTRQLPPKTKATRSPLAGPARRQVR